MALSLEKLFLDTKNKYQLSIIAGKNGLNRLMNWVYISEDLNTAEFLQGGEFVITTGLSCVSIEDWLYHFVETMIRRNTAGLILNTGKYILADQISEKIIDLCNEHDYPMFTMPWHIHIYDISKDYYNRIFLHTQEDTTINHGFLSILRQDEDLKKSMASLESYGYSLTSDYYISVMQMDSIIENTSRIHYLIDSESNHTKITCNTIILKSNIITIFNSADFSSIKKLITNIQQSLTKYHKNIPVYVGISGHCSSLSKLNQSYIQANAALSIGKFKQITFSFYDDMGFFKLLLAVNDKKLLENYVKEQIGELQEYDLLHSSNYVETLRSYLDNNGSIQSIANDLFCHRNTVNYRVRALKENFHLELENPKVCHELITAFLIIDYLSYNITN